MEREEMEKRERETRQDIKGIRKRNKISITENDERAPG